jgi:hypothetical protein
MNSEKEVKQICRKIIKEWPTMSAEEIVSFAIKDRDLRKRLAFMTGSDAEYFMKLLILQAKKVTKVI